MSIWEARAVDEAIRLRVEELGGRWKPPPMWWIDRFQTISGYDEAVRVVGGQSREVGKEAAIAIAVLFRGATADEERFVRLLADLAAADAMTEAPADDEERSEIDLVIRPMRNRVAGWAALQGAPATLAGPGDGGPDVEQLLAAWEAQRDPMLDLVFRSFGVTQAIANSDLPRMVEFVQDRLLEIVGQFDAGPVGHAVRYRVHAQVVAAAQSPSASLRRKGSHTAHDDIEDYVDFRGYLQAWLNRVTNGENPHWGEVTAEAVHARLSTRFGERFSPVTIRLWFAGVRPVPRSHVEALGMHMQLTERQRLAFVRLYLINFGSAAERRAAAVEWERRQIELNGVLLDPAKVAAMQSWHDWVIYELATLPGAPAEAASLYELLGGFVPVDVLDATVERLVSGGVLRRQAGSLKSPPLMMNTPGSGARARQPSYEFHRGAHARGQASLAEPDTAGRSVEVDLHLPPLDWPALADACRQVTRKVAAEVVQMPSKRDAVALMTLQVYPTDWRRFVTPVA